jgi:hypothetical protein
MADSLENTFRNAVLAFNNTFTHAYPYTAAELNNFGQYYDDHVRVTTLRHGTIVDKPKVLDNFARSSPSRFGPYSAFTNLVIDEKSGTVSGDGPFQDTDNGTSKTVQLHFDFKWVLTPAGWIVTVAKAQ